MPILFQARVHRHVRCQLESGSLDLKLHPDRVIGKLDTAAVSATHRATSQMEAGPALHSAFSISQRRAVRICHSSSGVAKLMRADFWRLPACQTWMRSAMAVWGGLTSSVTILMGPPSDVCLEILGHMLDRSCTTTFYLHEQLYCPIKI